MICIYIYCYISCTLYIAIFNFMSALCIVLSCVFITYIYMYVTVVSHRHFLVVGVCATLMVKHCLGTWRSVPATYVLPCTPKFNA